MIPLLFVAALTATFRPAPPTVGDLVTIDFARPATIDGSKDYEIVSQHGTRAVIRTFVPHAITIRGHAGGEPFAMRMPVRSVLKPNDSMQPAPLAPPHAVPYPRTPFVVIGIVALLAAAAWAGVFAVARWRAREKLVEPPLAPAERFRRAVAAARSWADLADAIRLYLAATNPNLSPDLTTSELLARMDNATIATILHQGDLEKFSPWGAEPADFHALAARALEVAA